MQLREFRVEKFRNILDSESVEVQGDVTCLVGKNESGKTALLHALYRVKPAYAAAFDPEAEYPRWLLIQDRKSGVVAETVPIRAVFELEDDDLAALDDLVGSGVMVERAVTLGLKYSGEPLVSLPLDEARAVANLLQRVQLQDVTRIEVQSCPDFAALQQAIEGQRAKANNGPPSPNIAWVTPEELDALQGEVARILQSHSSLCHAVVALLHTRLPTFFYFDEHSSLPGRINLSELRSAPQARPGQNDMQTARALLQLASTDISDLSNENYEFQKAELEAVSNDLTHQVFEYWTQNTSLSVEIDVDKEISHTSQGQITVAQFLDVRVKDQRHGFTNNFSRRSSGFQWFFSFLAAFSEFEGAESGVIILLDEPGLSLHAKAQEDFLRFIDNRLAPASQVIYTTHSPFMVEMGHLDRVRIVEDRGPETGAVVSSDALSHDRDSIFPLQAALGYDIAQSLFVGPDNLVIEGISDYTYLRILSDFLAERGRTGLDHRWRLLPAGGAANIPAFVALIGPHLDVTVLVDSGARGMQRLEDMAVKGLLTQQRLITIGQIVGSRHADIEDLFTEDDYLSIYNPVFGTKHTAKSLPAGDRLVVRLTALNGEFDHGKPAEYLLQHRDALCPSFAAATLARFEALFQRVNATLA